MNKGSTHDSVAFNESSLIKLLWTMREEIARERLFLIGKCILNTIIKYALI